MIDSQIKDFLVLHFEESEANRLPEQYGGGRIFSDPLLGIARGDDPKFQEYKKIISPKHLTPLEMWQANGNEDLDPSELRVLSIVFPFVDKIRKESKNVIQLKRMVLPAEIYCVGRNYANEFKEVTCAKTIEFLQKQGFKGVAGMYNDAFSILTEGEFHSTWSERHIAFTAGLGTFSLHDGFISEAGCNIRLASVITNAPLTVTERKSEDPYGNCLFYAKGTCGKCIERCPQGAITEKGHDKNKCYAYEQKVGRKVNKRIGEILKPHWRHIDGVWKEQLPPVGCAFCQFNVPCMDTNPMAAEQKKA